MAPQETEVISALNLLRNAPIDLLKVHRHQALQTVTQIGRVLNASWNENEYFSHGVDVEPGNIPSESSAIPDTAIPQADPSLQIIGLEILHGTSPVELPINLPGRETPALSSTNSSQNETRKRKRQTARDPPSAALIKSDEKATPLYFAILQVQSLSFRYPPKRTRNAVCR